MAQAAQSGSGGNRLFGGGGGGGMSMRTVGAAAGGGPGGGEGQMRQRMIERFQQDFAAFRASLDEEQARRWDSGLRELLSAKRATAYRLLDGKPQPVALRIGATDGTNTEVSGGIKEGDLMIVGERPKE